MAHLQLLYGDVECKTYRLKILLRCLGYSSLAFEGDGMCNERGNTYIVTKNGGFFTNSTMSTAVNWGKMCLTEDEFLNEAIREIRMLEKEKIMETMIQEMIQKIKTLYEKVDKDYNHGYTLLESMYENNDLQEGRTDYSTLVSYAMDAVRMLDDIKSIIEKEEK